LQWITKPCTPGHPQNLLNETSFYISREIVVALRKNGCHFGKDDDRLKIVSCREDEPICCDESLDPKGPFCFFYTTVFKKVLLRLPLTIFEKKVVDRAKCNSCPATPK